MSIDGSVPNAFLTPRMRSFTAPLDRVHSVRPVVRVGARPERREDDMLDVVMIGITVAFFAVAFLSIRWFDRI